MDEGSPARPSRHSRAELATFLSFLWPGAGQWYAGRARAALAFAVPITLVAAVVAIAAVVDAPRLAIRLFEPGVAFAVLVLVAIAGAWRLASMVHADRSIGGPGRPSARRIAVLGGLGAVVVGSHLAVAAVAWGFDVAGREIFVADPVVVPTAPPPSPAPGQTVGPAATPGPTPRPPRINILLTGIDSASYRRTLLTDTLIVASIDPLTGATAMISFPRDIAHFPLWDGRTYSGKINELMAYARRNPTEFPDGPMATLTREVGYLLGVPVEHYASVNLEGFERMIDEVGGVTIVNERAINDPGYGGWRDGRVGFRLSAGRHTLDGQTALAYARSRKGAGDSDFSRARRQQQLLVALGAKLTDPTMLPRLPAILDAAGDTVSTNFPRERLGDLLELGRRVDQDGIRQYVLGPPYATHPPSSTTGGIYTLALDFDKVAALSIDLFGSDSRYAQTLGAP